MSKNLTKMNDADWVAQFLPVDKQVYNRSEIMAALTKAFACAIGDQTITFEVRPGELKHQITLGHFPKSGDHGQSYPTWLRVNAAKAFKGLRKEENILRKSLKAAYKEQHHGACIREMNRDDCVSKFTGY